MRLTELLAAVSLGTDLGMGHPMEHVLRQSFIALRLADRLGLEASEREAVYYSSLLAWVGCHVDAYEQAKWFGDDLALKHDIRLVDEGNPAQVVTFVLRHLGAGRPRSERARLAATFLGGGRHVVQDINVNHFRAVDMLIERLALSDTIRRSVGQTFERWDGKGDPDGAKGEQLLMPTRLVNLADVVEVFHHAGGVDAAVAVAKERSGTQFDPTIVELFCASAAEIFDELDSASTWDAVMAAGPAPDRELSEWELDVALEAVADFIDLKSPYTLGHSRGVADTAHDAAVHLGMAPEEVSALRRAGLLHDLGRLGVSNAIWDKAAPLTQAEMERVRMHPYFTERMLLSCPALAELAPIAVHHHERLDGSGYPRGLAGDAISMAGRVLMAADLYRSKLEPRPHRPAAGVDEAAAHLRAEVRAARIDGGAAEAVLSATGHRARRRREWPAGLTARQVEVLRLVARGMSQREIAEALVISRKTASNHIEHVYAKTGATNRAMAALFAVKHGLISANDPAPGT